MKDLPLLKILSCNKSALLVFNIFHSPFQALAIANRQGTTIYADKGLQYMPYFGEPFFEQEIKFGISFLVKSQVDMHSGVSY